jgi:hypothetical protein
MAYRFFADDCRCSTMPVKVYKGIKRQMRVCRGLTYHCVRLRLEGKLYLLGVVGKEASEVSPSW